MIGYRAQRIVLPSSATELAYLAGIFDGEGSLTRYEPKPHEKNTTVKFIVSVTNTDRELIDWLERLGGKAHEKPGQFGRKPCYRWMVQGRRDVYAFLVGVSPYIRIKRDMVAAAIEEIRGQVGVVRAA